MAQAHLPPITHIFCSDHLLPDVRKLQADILAKSDTINQLKDQLEEFKGSNNLDNQTPSSRSHARGREADDIIALGASCSNNGTEQLRVSLGMPESTRSSVDQRRVREVTDSFPSGEWDHW